VGGMHARLSPPPSSLPHSLRGFLPGAFRTPLPRLLSNDALPCCTVFRVRSTRRGPCGAAGWGRSGWVRWLLAGVAARGGGGWGKREKGRSQ
jgi:hypothetical protein